MCLNQVTLIGYAGDAPKVLKETKQGKFVRFTLATTTKYTDKKGQLQQKTEWLSALKISDPFLLKKTDPRNAQRLFVE